MDIARLAERLTIGGLFIGHGTQKLFGWFGGPGLDGTEQMMRSLKLYPPRQQAVVAGVVEAGAGALVVAGLGTPLATSALIGVMTTAIKDAHWSDGLWNTKGGYEYNLALIAALATLAQDGPGAFSLDRALGTERRGPWWAVGAVAVGAAGAFVTTKVGRRLAAKAEAEARRG
ncbi:DoxX family protein [Nocardioides sp. KR10-350]|uniref:DoxX family protein n=1 Tax=Nocardioides cheoyonin TaxID=3156615 RepID=UPI0032B456BF